MAATNYPVGDFLIRVKNAANAHRESVDAPVTKFIKSIAQVLKDEGYVRDIEVKKGIIDMKLAYSRKEPVLMDIKLVSKPGLRIYKGVDEVKKHKRGASILILSTPDGVISSKKALKKGVGGEVIAEIW